jgi:hypothetical protein
MIEMALEVPLELIELWIMHVLLLATDDKVFNNYDGHLERLFSNLTILDL